MKKRTIKCFFFGLFAVLATGLLFTRCKKIGVETDSASQLSFSTDTVLFDTVFTRIGSTTKRFKIYNPHNKRINISNIQLAAGASSNFRINIDGVPGISYKNIEVLPQDSIFAFVEVTLDPNGANAPLVIEDSLLFETNGNAQNVKLVAWGQDAYFHLGEVLACSEVWNNDKPHVIFGYAAVDSACTLTINAGTQVHLHNRSSLLIYKGSLDVNGSFLDPVVFQGDRLEPEYDNVPGQWSKIQFFFPRNSKMDYAIIKNGNIGLQVDTLSEDGMGSNGLTLKNTIIENMAAAGIFSQGSTISGENLLVNNCGQFCAVLTIGGSYNFRHCTFANFWNGNRQDPLFAMTNWYEDVNGGIQIRPIVHTRFDNCIFYGSNDEEFALDLRDEASQDYIFNHCILKTEASLSDAARYHNVFKNQDPQFIDEEEQDYRLIRTAFARNKGDAAYNTSNMMDYYGSLRNDQEPDPGYFERKD